MSRVVVGWDEGDQVFIDLEGTWNPMSNEQPRSVWVVSEEVAKELRDRLNDLFAPPPPLERDDLW